MSEHPGRQHLNDYLDGELDTDVARSVERHLASCVSCRRELQSLRELVARAADLPRSIQPEKDLWSEIRGRIEDRAEGVTPLRRGRWSRWNPSRTWQVAAAAALLVAATATITWTVANGGVGESPTVAVRSALESGEAGDGQPLDGSAESGGRVGSLVARELAPAEGDYLRSAARLLEILDENRDQLAPETREALDRTLATIDRAIRDLRAALEEDPDSRSLGLLLESTYQQKLEVLRQAVRAVGA